MADDYCTDYHCCGDCGLHGSGFQHSPAPVSLSAARRKRLTLAAFDRMQHEKDRTANEKRAEVERLARQRM